MSKIEIKLKRFIDILLSSILILIILPLLFLVSLLVLIKLGKPIFFIQERPGINNTVFKMIKFRSMKNQPNGANLSDAERLTGFGKWMRRLSIDELPQLWNVLKGEMSLVGPRPLLLEYLAHFSPQQLKRQSMLPGITGWCQINGRNDLPWSQKLDLDVWYVKNWSLWLDFKILFMTPFIVIFGRGVNKKGHVTTDKFYT